MAAAMNGIALHGGLIPYSGSFLIFSDYCRPPIRLAALMGIRVIHVLTHDSIGLGEDGPTHQPVEHLAALRAIPNLLMFRPADAMETAECWQLALEPARSPVGPRADPPEPAGGAHRISRRKPLRLRRLRAGRRQRRCRGDDLRLRLGSRDRARGREALLEAKGIADPRRLGALLRTLRRADRRVPQGRSSATRRSRSPSKPASARAGTASSARTASSSA